MTARDRLLRPLPPEELEAVVPLTPEEIRQALALGVQHYRRLVGGFRFNG